MGKEIKCCEYCGQPKPVSEFSKSYRNRCKECVAILARAKRANKKHPNSKSAQLIIVDDPINWEQRRYEIAKNYMAATYTMPGYRTDTDFKERARFAVGAADALINELKKQ